MKPGIKIYVTKMS